MLPKWRAIRAAAEVDGCDKLTKMTMEDKLAKRRTELLDQIELVARERGIVAIRDTALLNAKNYAREQLEHGFDKGLTQDKLEIEGLERHLHSMRNQGG